MGTTVWPALLSLTPAPLHTVHSSVSGDSCSEAHTNHDNHDYIIDLISEALSRACVENISERVCDIIDNIISGDESDEVGDINAVLR